MTGTWLGQQPLKQQRLGQQPMQRTVTSSATVLWCLLLACSGCVDIVARTAGLPITGNAPPEEGVAVVGDVTSRGKTLDTDISADGKAADETAADGSATDSVVVGSGVSERQSFDSPSSASRSSAVASSRDSPDPGSADRFPDAAEVGLATDSVAD